MNRKIYRICLVVLILATVTASTIWCYQVWQQGQQTVVTEGELV